MSISREQALDCFRSDDLIGIGMEANAVRRRLHPEGVVSYSLDGTIGCAGVSIADIHARVFETTELGGTGMNLLGVADTSHTLANVVELFASLKREFPRVWLHGLSANAISSLAAGSEMSVPETLARLRGAGLDSISGEDAAVLGDDARSRDWVAVHRSAHALGLPTTAAMSFGAGETVEQRVAHLDILRGLQDETRGFTAFVPRGFHGGAPQDEATAVEYLTTLAIARVYLDNIENVEADWTTQGLKVLQMALRFGANDAGSLSAPGGGWASEEEVRQIVRDAGLRPVQRDTVYRTMFLS